MGTPRKRPIRQKKPPKPKTPKQRRDWDRPVLPTTGDADQDTTFAAIGRALSAWEALEGALGHIFAATLGVPWYSEMPTLRAYGAVASFSGRADMLNAAIEASFFGKTAVADRMVKAGLERLIERAIGFSGRRNDIAHGVVGEHPHYYSGTGALFSGPQTLGFVLLPSYFATGKRKLAVGGLITPVVQAPVYYYSSREMMVFTEHFLRLDGEARHIYGELLNLGSIQKPQYQQPSEQPKG
jgi:hypothetical protein